MIRFWMINIHYHSLLSPLFIDSYFLFAMCRKGSNFLYIHFKKVYRKKIENKPFTYTHTHSKPHIHTHNNTLSHTHHDLTHEQFRLISTNMLRVLLAQQNPNIWSSFRTAAPPQLFLPEKHATNRQRAQKEMQIKCRKKGGGPRRLPGEEVRRGRTGILLV